MALLMAGCVVGLAGTDLVLPVVPALPGQLGGTPGQAQLVLSAYALGVAVGLLVCGTLSARVRPRWMLCGGLLTLACMSFVASLTQDVTTLILLRLLQGVASSVPMVLAPMVLRRLFDPAKATRALGLLSSVESLVPALAPLMGTGLVVAFGWRGPFIVLAGATAILLAVAVLCRKTVPDTRSGTRSGSYATLLRNGKFLRQAAAHAITLGGLLVFVFGAPAVVVHHLGGSMGDFILMQVSGIVAFIAAASTSASLAGRYGAGRVIILGSTLALLAALALVVYAVTGGRDTMMLIPLFVPMNAGLGLRGPLGFMLALDNADDDTRGAGLIVLFAMVVAAAGNAAVAALLDGGLPVLTTATAVLLLSAWVSTIPDRKAKPVSP